MIHISMSGVLEPWPPSATSSPKPVPITPAPASSCATTSKPTPALHDLSPYVRSPGVRAVVPIESTENAQSEFLRLGADVEIIEPAELRARISAVAHSLAAIYPAHQPGQANS
jgi:predicted DNA-binding transcriptional regulator YafY